MNRLAELLPFNAGETVASYCSRLAAACGYRHARSFGFDLGFRFQGLAIGDEPELEKFASILDVSASSLSSGAVVTNGHMNVLACEKLTRSHMERQRLRFCPFCVQDDERDKGGRRGFRPYGRLSWLVKPIRACRHHRVRLITSDRKMHPMFIHDFAANLAAEADKFNDLLSAAAPMEPDTLQRYVEARLRGAKTGSAWLDTMPLYVAVRLCETVGASERHGIRFHSNALDEREWSTCAGAGFDLLRDGENDFRNWLQSHLVSFLRSKHDMGGRAIFGRLYEWLAHETSDVAFNPIRDIMRDVALCNIPLGPGDDFFGPVTERRLHSVYSASKKFGVHPKRLRKLLSNCGLVSVQDSAKTFERVLLDAAVMERFAVEARSSLDVPEAKAYLGVRRVQFERLVKHEFIKPHGGDRSASNNTVDRRFLPVDLDEFLGRLRSAVTCSDNRGLSSLQEVVRKAGCTFAEVIGLILGGELRTVALSPDCVGIAAIRLDVDEVKKGTACEDHRCITLHRLETLIPAPSRIIKALVGGGHLPSVQRQNPVKRNMQTVVEAGAFLAFMEEFVSLGSLATACGTKTWSLKRELDNAGVSPVFIAADMPFYRRPETLAYMFSE
jgi:hypothetical protein